MTNYLSLVGSLVASVVALSIAVWNARRTDQLRAKDRDNAARAHQAEQLATLLTLHTTAIAAGQPTLHDAEMKAILLTLPGNLATVLRLRLRLNYTVTGVPLDPASKARLREDETDSGHKWLIFDRSSALTSQGFVPRAEWVEAELAYDIAGLRGSDQEAVLAALKLNPATMTP